MFDNLERYLIRQNATAQLGGITSIPIKSFWSCIQTTLKWGNYLDNVVGLCCVRVHIISLVISGMTNPKAVVSKFGQINGIEPFVRSPQRRKISSGKLRHGGPCNPIKVDIFATCDKKYGKWAQRIGKSYAGNLENPPSSCRSSKYISCKKRWSGPTKPCGISRREIQQFSTFKLQADWCSQVQEGVFIRQHIWSVK